MREALDHDLFVLGAYAVAVVSTLALLAQSWLAMKKAEARRDAVKRR